MTGTFFQPDEYFRASEPGPAHYLVFGLQGFDLVLGIKTTYSKRTIPYPASNCQSICHSNLLLRSQREKTAVPKVLYGLWQQGLIYVSESFSRMTPGQSYVPNCERVLPYSTLYLIRDDREFVLSFTFFSVRYPCLAR